MKRILSFAISLFCLAASMTTHAQPVQELRAATAVQRSSIVASDVELVRRRDTVQAELARLDAEQRVSCQGGAQSVNCQRFIASTQARRAALVRQAEFNQRHPAGKACTGCHAGPGAAPATDPIRTGLPSSGSGTTAGGTSSAGGSTPGSSGSSGSGGGGTITPPATRCFIATAAWGSAWAPEVQVLRRFRDQQLRPHPLGRWLVAGYEWLSPPLADWIAPRPLARAAVRATLTPIVWGLVHPVAALGGCGLVLVLSWIAWRRRKARRA